MLIGAFKRMKIQQLLLEEFTAFEKAAFNFSPGINVLIGANSTGKSHLMKTVYSLLKVCETAHLNKIDSREKIQDLLKNKLEGIFKPDGVGRLVRRGRGNRSSNINLTYSEAQINVTITTQNKVLLEYGRTLPNPTPSVYLPAHEFLSASEGFISAYTQRETAFDETYYDLSLALDAKPLRGPRLVEIRDLIEPLEKAISGKVIKENGRFYVKLLEGKLEAHLVSEGYRKLAGLIYLINNGSLTQNGILYWDEPEANLNPKLIAVVVGVLKTLVNSGVQIFIATHDYLLSQELSLLSEYPSDTQVKFFALYQPKKRAGVIVESGASLAEIENNPILDEFAAYYDREAKLFQNSKNHKGS